MKWSGFQYTDEAGTKLQVREYYGRNFLFTITQKGKVCADAHLSVPEPEIEQIVKSLRALVAGVIEVEQYGGGLVRNCGSCGHAEWPESVSTYQEKRAVFGKCASPLHCLPVSVKTIERESIGVDYGHECPAWKPYKE